MRFLALLASLIFVASGAEAAQVLAHATATIVAPVSVTETQALAFGNLASPAVDTVFTMAPNGTITSGGNLVAGAAPLPGKLTVTGQNGLVVQISIPPTMTISGVGVTIPVTLSTDLPPANTVTLSGAGAVVNVGASFTAQAGQAQGTYAGSFTVTANYQ